MQDKGHWPGSRASLLSPAPPSSSGRLSGPYSSELTRASPGRLPAETAALTLGQAHCQDAGPNHILAMPRSETHLVFNAWRAIPGGALGG